MNLAVRTYIGSKGKPKSSKKGTLYVFGAKSKKKIPALLKGVLHPWEIQSLQKEKTERHLSASATGPVWVILLNEPSTQQKDHGGHLDPSAYALARDQVGAVAMSLVTARVGECKIYFEGLSDKEIIGAIVGLEIAAYKYQEIPFPSISFFKSKKPLSLKLQNEALSIARAVNQARHLTNLPANLLHPQTYAIGVRKLFEKSKKTKVEVWDSKRLKKEKLNLLLAVGGSAEFSPRMVILRYRPPRAQGKKIAFVGKGITFDSGGLNLKPGQYMRLMKKDMGGSAALVGLAYWLDQSSLKVPVDFYLALAENAVDQKSYRPGDILTSRNGMEIEIDNTDAEGRLALADGMEAALAEKPRAIIDVATLTGASNVALGKEMSALFSNHDRLAAQLEKAAHHTGDLTWRLPLYRPYKSGLRSAIATLSNSGPPHGGAITAALFLEAFTKNTPWAHLDIYGWKDSPSGPYTQPGGSGQSVQQLIEFLKNLRS